MPLSAVSGEVALALTGDNMTILLILVTTWFLIGAVYAIAIIRHLDEYSAEWFVKYLRIDDQEHEFKDERQKKQ